jgi:hypothetical protein
MFELLLDAAATVTPQRYRPLSSISRARNRARLTIAKRLQFLRPAGYSGQRS